LSAPAVLVTGAAGMLGRALVAALADGGVALRTVVATDLHPVADAERRPGIVHAVHDVREPGLQALLRAHRIDTVVHLASIVTPGLRDDRATAHAVDVEGTRRVLGACVAAGVKRLVVSSSGAAYGYHADNPAWLTEDMPLRGNDEFAYAQHKRLVEALLAHARIAHPELEQVVLRIGTILGERLHNQITALFERDRPLAIRGSDSPFVFVWIDDVVGAILHAIAGGPAGVYNLAGDGALTMPEIATRLGKRCRVVPAWLLRAALAVAKPLGLTPYGPEQVGFLRWRPVLDNTRLKNDFGFVPRHSSAQAFERWAASCGFGVGNA
jgi:UDP-glucose 4-epimerase